MGTVLHFYGPQIINSLPGGVNLLSKGTFENKSAGGEFSHSLMNGAPGLSLKLRLNETCFKGFC